MLDLHIMKEIRIKNKLKINKTAYIEFILRCGKFNLVEDTYLYIESC